MTRVAALGVVAPARDEAHRVGACLRSLLAAAARVDVPCRIVLVDDGSRDATAAVAERLLGPAGHLVERTPPRGVGAARRLGVALLAEAFAAPADRVWIASTDADSTVPRDWLRRHVDHAAAGVDALAGIVQLDAAEADPTALARFATRYGAGLRPDGHRHVHAANLGVRLSSYLSVGGFPDLPSGEEHALWRRLRALGVRPVADRRLAVVTSARLTGRAPDGFAADLRADARQRVTSGPADRSPA